MTTDESRIDPTMPARSAEMCRAAQARLTLNALNVVELARINGDVFDETGKAFTTWLNMVMEETA